MNIKYYHYIILYFCGDNEAALKIKITDAACALSWYAGPWCQDRSSVLSAQCDQKPCQKRN